MRVWIDGQGFQTASRRRGIGRYVNELIRAVRETAPDVRLSISFNAALPEAAIAARESMRGLVADEDIHFWQGAVSAGEAVTGHSPAYRLSERALAHHVAILDPDVALTASPLEGFVEPIVPLVSRFGHRFPLAAIFYDAIPLRFEDKYLLAAGEKAFYRRRLEALRSSDLILAISDFARREAEDLIPGPRVETIHAGVSAEITALTQRPDAAKVDGLEPPVLTYVGALDWRKNVAAVVDAIARLDEPLRSELTFAMAGDMEPRAVAALGARWRAAGLKDEKLKTLGYVPTSSLIALYRQSDAVIQPSRMEGFGLTVLEAILCGAPVIASSAGAISEIVRDRRAQFDPADVDGMSRLIAKVVQDREFALELLADGRERLAEFTWSRTARLCVQALTGIAATSRPPVTLSTTRATTAASLGKALRRDAARAAGLLAAAEPVQPRPRLLIDVSHAAKVHNPAGIQRVVRSIAAQLTTESASRELPVALIQCNSGSRFRRAELASGGSDRSAGKRKRGGRIAFNPGDRVIMLDSAWAYLVLQERALRGARLRGVRIVTVLYDLVPMRVPGFTAGGTSRQFVAWFQRALEYSTGFVCISRAVADELMALLQAIGYPRPMAVGYWHLGADFVDRTEALVAAPPAADPTFLAVGTVEPRKGYDVILKAFDTLWADGLAVNLIVAGAPGWGTERLQATLRSHPETSRRLRWIEDADDAALAGLYASSDALIAASQYEGFGLPLVEAGRLGRPVIASRIPVFEEIAGGSPRSMFFEPGSSQALAAAIRDFVTTRRDHDPASASEATGWTTWADSAARLRDIVMDDDWYQIYAPEEAAEDPFEAGIGHVTMTEPLAPDLHCARVELLEGPAPANGLLRFIVKVTNLSGKLWAGCGPGEGDDYLAVGLGHRLVRGDGETVVGAEAILTPIPFVLAPDDWTIMAVDIEAKWRSRGVRSVDFQVLQQGAGWLGPQLRVPL